MSSDSLKWMITGMGIAFALVIIMAPLVKALDRFKKKKSMPLEDVVVPVTVTTQPKENPPLPDDGFIPVAIAIAAAKYRSGL